MSPSSHHLRILTMAAVKKGLQLSLVVHALVYAFVLAGLWGIGQHYTEGHASWVAIVAWAWGLGLAVHAAVWVAFGRHPRR
jgi:hypothetical protein